MPSLRRTLTALLGTLGLISATALSSAAPALAAPTTTLPLGHHHLYATTPYGAVVSVKADGTESQLHRLGLPDRVLVSPNGRLHAVVNSTGIVVENRDGSHGRRLTKGMGNDLLAWAPDSHSVLAQLGTRGLNIVHVSDGRTRRLPYDDLTEHAAFTPDGKYILLTARHGWSLIRTSTGVVRSFRKAPCAQPLRLGFSADGRTISFACLGSTGGVGWTGLMTIATGAVHRLGDWRTDFPVWLGSDRVAVTYASDNTLGNQIRVFDLQGRLVAVTALATRAVFLFSATS